MKIKADILQDFPWLKGRETMERIGLMMDTKEKESRMKKVTNVRGKFDIKYTSKNATSRQERGSVDNQ